jgi:hypothetical protein
MPSKNFQKKLWEILVPKYSNEGKEYSLIHHQKWDDYVRGIAGGLTIFKKSRGQWISPEGQLFSEEMIPVRICCSSNNLNRIVDFTLNHYDQLAVMAYEISNNIIIKYRKQQSLKTRKISD